MHNSAVANVIVKTTIQSNDIVKMYLNNTQFHATFLNPHGMPLTNTEVTFNINGIFYKKWPIMMVWRIKNKFRSWKLYNNNY